MPEVWLSKSGQLAQREPEYSKARYQYYYRHSNNEKACKDYDNFMDTLKTMQTDLKSGAITEKQFIAWLEEQ